MLEAATDEQAGKLLKAMLKYQATGEAEVDDPLLGAIFEMVKEGIDKDNKAYEETCERRRQAALKRWEADQDDACKSMQEHANACNSMQKHADKDLDLDLDLDIHAPTVQSKRARAKFAPPSVEQVEAYAKERGSKVDPAAFVDFYASKGWKVGNQPMKDWKAALRTWERREPTGKPKAPPGRFSNERTAVDYNEMERRLIQKARGAPA